MTIDQPAKPPTPRWAKIVAAVFTAALVLVCGGVLVSIVQSGSGSPSPASTPDLGADAQRVCREKFIPDRLKAPATAKFSDVHVATQGGLYLVTGAVDSQNSFGALIRSTFVCAVRSSGADWVLDSASVQ